MAKHQGTQAQASGGSALKRLRKSLQAAGVVGNQSKASRSKKDRKKGKPTEAGKNDTAEKLRVIREEFNPFEIKATRQKFDVVNRKVKGAAGKPALNKQIGEENRKKTLLVEMKSKGHVGGIIDKRFGENNPHLTPEEKMLERFTRERQKHAKQATSMFNLDDDDEDIQLTHYGQSLAEIDDFDDTGLRLSDDEDDKGQLSKEMVSQMHFGGFEDGQQTTEDGKPKSRSEIMKEIIAKSKFYKHERQMAKQEDEALRQDLDEELDEIRDLLDMKSKRKPLAPQSALFAKAESAAEKQEGEKEEKINDYEDYDKALRDLAHDRRAMATDRTKTEEEIALEEKEKLEKAERARKRRMEGLESESEDEEPKRGRNKRRKTGAPQGDDLDDDYLEELEDEVNRLGQGLTLEAIQNAAGPDEEESDEEDEGEEDEDEESGENDDDDDEAEYDEETDNEDLEDDETPQFADDDDDMNEFGAEGSVIKKAASASSTKKTKAGKTKGEIPYTFECPSTHGEFLEIMEPLSHEDAPTVVKRIRVLYHLKLSPENKSKMSRFLSVLVEYLGYVASTVTPFPAETVESLMLQIFEISQQLPEASADVFIEKLKQIHGSMTQKMNTPGSAFPDVEDFTILRCLGKVFPTSDLTHPVATPAMLYMSQAMALCKITSEIDIGRGLFLTLLFLEYQSVSKRMIPEALNFLQRSLYLLAPEHIFKDNVPGNFPLPEAGKVNLHITDTLGNGIANVRAFSLEEMGVETVEEQDKQELRLSLVQGSIRIMSRYLQLYASTPAFVEIFEPILNFVSKLTQVSWHPNIQELLVNLQDRLQKQIKFCKDKRAKTPIKMQQHRPIPIAQHLPKFEKGYSMDKHYDPDRERAELNKLKAQVKKEKKGAMRELRKDNMFMAREKLKARKQQDEEYKKKMNSVMALLESEQAEKKRMDKKKRKLM